MINLNDILNHLSKKLFIITLGLFYAAIPVLAQNISKEVKIQKEDQYLNFPIEGWSNDFEGGNQKMMRIIHNGEVLDEFRINISNTKPDWWAFFPVQNYQGETLTVELDDSEDRKSLDMVFSDSEFPGQDEIYKERYRQQVHFSQRRGWNNDPNGLIYYNGEWHLFYQHNPYGWGWGNMHWGHAVSTDLVHWKELPDALYSPNHRQMAFSGGAVVDPDNTSGFRRDGVDPLIVTYTRTGSGEHIALSYDNGRTFEEYEGNPIIKHRGRDPKVFWYEPGKHWVMIVYTTSQFRDLGLKEEALLYQQAIYTSSNLKEWEYQSGISDFFECPELFELPIEGEEGMSKWVMYDAYGKYIVGEFDGKEFKTEQSLRRFEYGDAFYASQTFSNVPSEDGRRIQIGWFRADTPYMPFNQSMTFPTELKLRKTLDGYKLTPTPIKEIEKLHSKSYKIENIVISDSSLTSSIRGDKLHIIAEFDKGSAVQFGLSINGYELSYDILKSAFFSAPSNENIYKNLNVLSPYDTFFPINETLKLEVIVDRMGMEVFVNDGDLYFVNQYNSVDTDQKVEVFARGRGAGKLLIKNLEVHELKSIWEKND